MTRPLCKYDLLNSTNVHRYVDNVPCILSLGRLENGRVVACFSVTPFVPTCVGTDAIIMGVSKKLVFYPKINTRRSICYDDYYVIYGNGELRFRSNSLGIFSNLGVNNGYFDAKGHNA